MAVLMQCKEERMLKILKISWLLLAILIHAFVIKGYLNTGSNEAYIAEDWLMLLITFPLGIIQTFIWSYLANTFDILNSNSPLIQTIPWVLSVILGYVQWFILLPSAIKYYKSKKIKNAKI